MINKYPYTDFNEYNMDWIIKTVKDLTVEWTETKTEWADTKTEWENYKNYIDNYFANLDLQEEVNNKINAMIADGTFSGIVAPFFQDAIGDIPDVVTDWLDTHVAQETGYVIDDTLTIALAAADAKAVGDALIRRDVATSGAVAGYFINSTDGSIAANANFSYVEFNVLDTDTVLYKTQRSETNIGIAFYDVLGRYISGAATDGTELQVPVPQDAVIGRAAYRTLQIANFYVKQCYNINVLYDHVSDLEKEAAYIDPIRKTVKLDYDNKINKDYVLSRTSSNTRICTQYIPLYDAISQIEVKGVPSAYQASIFFFDYDGGPAAGTGPWTSTEFTYLNPHMYKGYRIYFRKPDNSTLGSADMTAIAATMTTDEYYAYPELTGYVDPAGNNTNTGLSRTYPLADIPAAISKGFKHILVKEGTYDPFTLSGLAGYMISIDTYYNTYTAGSDEDNPKIVINGDNSEANGIIISDCKDLTLIGFEVKDCVTNGIVIDDSTDVKITDCIVHDIAVGQTAGQGYKITDTDAVFYNCGAYNIGTTSAGAGRYHIDGFNIHNTGSVDLYNCWAYNCEDDGVSHHDACIGVIDGGEYHHCGKGGVASPSHGATVNVKNVYSHDNAYGIYAATTGSTLISTRPAILISCCACKNNNNYDILTDNFYTVRIWNTLYDTDSFGSDTQDLNS